MRVPVKQDRPTKSDGQETTKMPEWNLKGKVVRGCGHFEQRTNSFPDVFLRAMAVALHLGTLNVDVGSPIKIKEEFRIRGVDIDEPTQDLLFERCVINGIPGFRIRPFDIATGAGGHGDNVLEINLRPRGSKLHRR